MAIWFYEEGKSSDLIRSFEDQLQLGACTFCNSPLTALAGKDLTLTIKCGGRFKSDFNSDTPTFSRMYKDGPSTQVHKLIYASDLRGYFNGNDQLLQTCPVCGWWVASLLEGHAPHMTHDGGYLILRRACGALKELDLADVSIPTDELRRYLLAKYGDRFDIHPRKYEEIVGSVFKDFGFRVRVTSFSGDEGIDVIVFDGTGGTIAGIQVKRQRGKITAEQIRSFLGALVLKGLTNGIYVTTSSYQRGAAIAAAEARFRARVAISLMDAQRFYDALNITSRAAYSTPDDPSAPYFERLWLANC